MKKILITALLFITSVTTITQAQIVRPESQPQYYTNIFPNGIYIVGEKNGALKPGEYEFSLITNNTVSYVYIIDKNNIERFSKRFDSQDIEEKGDKNTSLVTRGRLLEGDTLIIYGKGEMYFNRIND